MAQAFNKSNIFVGDLGRKVHDLNGDLIKVYLSNAAPSATTHKVKADVAEITNQNGYTAPVSVTPVYAQDTSSTGIGTLSGTKVVVTASGAVGPFRYVMLYNDTPTSPTDPLIGWWDYGSSISLANGETFSVKFNSSDTTGTILTLQ